MPIFEALTLGLDIPAEDALIWMRYKIMQRMHWTYREYCQTPARIVAEVWAMIMTEAKAIEAKRA